MSKLNNTSLKDLIKTDLIDTQLPSKEALSTTERYELETDISFLKPMLNFQYLYELPLYVKEKYPNCLFRLVDAEHPHKPYNVHEKIENGWRFVLDDAITIDHRGNSVRQKQNSKPGPLFVKKTSGRKAVWLYIPIDVYEKRLKKKSEDTTALRTKQCSRKMSGTTIDLFDRDRAEI